MKVRSEDLAKVRFPEGRRGYDADKVDAVLSEIIETLREYEAADEALHRTFVEAQRIKEDMIGEAKVEADAARAEGDEAKAAAQLEAEELVKSAKADAAAKRTATEENVATAKAEIERRLADADREAAGVRAAAQADGTAIREEATKEAEGVKVAAAADAHNVVSEARKEAKDMLREAKAEHAELSKKVPQLRTAVGDIRARLIELAESAQNELLVVDGMIDLASEEAVPEVITAAAEPQQAAPVAEQPNPGPDAEPAPEPEAKGGDIFDSAALKAKASDLNEVAPDGQAKETFYGSGLRKRLTEGGAKAKKTG